MLWRTITTGKVNDSAANSRVPKSPTKKVSARLNSTMLRVPMIMGMVILTRVLPIAPWVRSLRFGSVMVSATFLPMNAALQKKRRRSVCDSAPASLPCIIS